MVDLQPRPRQALPPELDPRGVRRVPRRRPSRRLLNLIALTLSLAILVLSFGGYIVVKWFDGSIARVHLNLGQDRPKAAGKGSENWLLVGTDNSATSEYGERAGVRSDTTILAHLDADGTTTNISFPRDTLVTIPSYTKSGGEVVPERMDKFNSAISDGGPSLLVQTVEKLTGVRVDHYVAVNLDGFAAISKALNGVKVCILPSSYKETGPDGGTITNISDGFSGFYGQVGEQTVAGESALAFVRQRHGLPRGDLDRIARQQQFLASVFRTATQTKVLFNPVAITRLLGAIKDSLTLDQKTSLTDLEKLAFRLKGVDPSKVTFETVPQRQLQSTDDDLGEVFYNGGLQLIPKGQSDSVGNVQILEREPFDAMIAKIKDEPAPPPTKSGTPAAAPSAAAAKPLTAAPSEVLVTVENGTRRSGLATTVSNALKQGGFQTGPAGNADNFAYSQSVIRYAAEDLEKARTVQAAIPGAVLKQDASVAGGIVLVLGTNYSLVQPVSVGGAGAVASAAPTVPAPAPVSTAPPVTAASNTCTN